MLADDVHHGSTREPTTIREDSAVSQVRTLGLPMEAAGATHPGRVRARNEDAFGIEEDLGLSMVADGLGGHAAGDVAARMAIQEILRYLREADTDPTPKETEDDDTAPRLTIGFLAEAVKQANKTIHLASRNLPECAGMATTIAAVLLLRGFAFLAHVGDTRIYRLRAGKLVRLTVDHSMAEEYLRARGSKADPELVRRNAGTLTRCLGTRADVRVAAQLDRCAPGDVYLLCTDGLWGPVDDEAIARAIMDARDMKSAAERLVELANEAGGSDNITAVLVRPLLADSDDPQGLQASA